MKATANPPASLLLEFIRNPFADFLGSLTAIREVFACSSGSLGKGLSCGLTFAVRQIANSRARPDSKILGALNNSHADLPTTSGDFLSRCDGFVRGVQ